MRNDFEASAAHLLPHDPVQKKRADQAVGKRGAVDISDVTGKEGNASSFGAKKGSGASGVPLCHHAKQECDSLDEWRKSSAFKGEKNKKGEKPDKFATTKAVASAVEKKAAKKLKAMEQEKAAEADTEACVMSIVNKCAGEAGKGHASHTNAEPDTPPKTPSLHSILKKAKNDSKANA
jgi:hypothetical protein